MLSRSRRHMRADRRRDLGGAQQDSADRSWRASARAARSTLIGGPASTPAPGVMQWIVVDACQRIAAHHDLVTALVGAAAAHSGLIAGVAARHPLANCERFAMQEFPAAVHRAAVEGLLGSETALDRHLERSARLAATRRWHAVNDGAAAGLHGEAVVGLTTGDFDGAARASQSGRTANAVVHAGVAGAGGNRGHERGAKDRARHRRYPVEHGSQLTRGRDRTRGSSL